MEASVGLCSRCRFASVQESGRGSRFWRCRRADSDAGFPRYPPLPVRRCPGYEEIGATQSILVIPGLTLAGESRVRMALDRIPVLQGLPEEVVLELSASGALRRFARDEIVFHEGDRGTTMYIVASGDVLLTTHDQKGVRREVARLAPGDFFGLDQGVLRQPSSVCARAMTDLTLVTIPGDAANRLLDRSPRLASDLGEAQEARRRATLEAKQGHTNVAAG